MKRNNLLLLSYIGFVCICVIVRIGKGGFEQWDAIVTAVAISSALLTCADYYSIYSNYFSKICDTNENFIENRRKSIAEEKENILKIQDRLKNSNIGKVNSSEKERETGFSDIFEAYSRIDSSLDDFEQDISKDKKKQKQFAFAADALTVLAFLEFLCIITFSFFAKGMLAVQDIVSVLAFVIILISQHISSFFSKKLEKVQIKSNNVAKLFDQQRDEVFHICNKWMSYLQEVEVDAD